VDGDITVSARETEDGYVRVEVADTGMGISEEDQEKLFASFYRARTAETTDIAGTGLGLFIVKSLVELMGGIVSLRSTLGEGSAFGFTLPIWRAESKTGEAA
jgi:signal transduction histidine kinase